MVNINSDNHDPHRHIVTTQYYIDIIRGFMDVALNDHIRENASIEVRYALQEWCLKRLRNFERRDHTDDCWDYEYVIALILHYNNVGMAGRDMLLRHREYMSGNPPPPPADE